MSDRTSTNIEALTHAGLVPYIAFRGVVNAW
jgi:hypothetical protein